MSHLQNEMKPLFGSSDFKENKVAEKNKTSFICLLARSVGGKENP